MNAQRTYTIAEAAELTGATAKAIRNRVDRGHLRVVKRNGVRRIPLSELERAGLLEEGLAGDAAPAGSEEARELVNLELLRELGQAHETIGELRALEVSAGGRAAELEETNARLRREAAEELARAQELEQELGRLRSRGPIARLLNR